MRAAPPANTSALLGNGHQVGPAWRQRGAQLGGVHVVVVTDRTCRRRARVPIVEEDVVAGGDEVRIARVAIYLWIFEPRRSDAPSVELPVSDVVEEHLARARDDSQAGGLVLLGRAKL